MKTEISSKTDKDTECTRKFSIASITNSFKHLKGGKASGVDGLAAEHFLYAMRFARGFGGMPPPREIFLKWCNLMRSGVYLDQTLSLKNFHFLYKNITNSCKNTYKL